MFAWSDDYTVGIPSIDAGRQSLFRIAAELYRALIDGQGKTALGRILDRLIQHVSAQFAHEEELMRRHRRPEFAVHKAQHEAFTRLALKFQADFRKGLVNLSVQVLQFLQDWLDRHIRGPDLVGPGHARPTAV